MKTVLGNKNIELIEDRNDNDNDCKMDKMMTNSPYSSQPYQNSHNNLLYKLYNTTKTDIRGRFWQKGA